MLKGHENANIVFFGLTLPQMPDLFLVLTKMLHSNNNNNNIQICVSPFVVTSEAVPVLSH